MTLPDGYHDIPAGKIAVVVTHLEMLAPAAGRPVSTVVAADGSRMLLDVRQIAEPPLDCYRALFRRVGQDWLWFSRLAMTDAQLAAIVHHPKVEVYALTRMLPGAGNGGVENVEDVGLLELDFRQPNECELAFFGVAGEMIGTGAARQLMNAAIARAWHNPAYPIRRFWVHTCTGDHPAAVEFYIRSGFRPFKRQIEIADDPRVGGGLPESVAPHLPLIRP